MANMVMYKFKHITTLYYLSDPDILSREWRVNVEYHGSIDLWYYNQSRVTELFIMRNPHYYRMSFKSVKTLVLRPRDLFHSRTPRALPYASISICRLIVESIWHIFAYGVALKKIKIGFLKV